MRSWSARSRRSTAPRADDNFARDLPTGRRAADKGATRKYASERSSSVQRPLDALLDEELMIKDRPGAYRIAEPFLAEWILRFAT